jgi:hypothetical protein
MGDTKETSLNNSGNNRQRNRMSFIPKRDGSLISNVNDNRIQWGYLDFVLNKQQWNLNHLIPRYLIGMMSLPAKDNTAIVGRTQMTMKEKWATPALTITYSRCPIDKVHSFTMKTNNNSESPYPVSRTCALHRQSLRQHPIPQHNQRPYYANRISRIV